MSAATNGALVQNLASNADRSNESKDGSAMIRWYCTGTSMVCVTRCDCASARYCAASNLPISTTVPPQPSVGKNTTSVVLEYSGVASSVTVPGPYP
ncbi:hypothetical protein D3C72_2229210 [compost metagenome]